LSTWSEVRITAVEGRMIVVVCPAVTVKLWANVRSGIVTVPEVFTSPEMFKFTLSGPAGWSPDEFARTSQKSVPALLRAQTSLPTNTVTVALPERTPSLALSCRRYVPGSLKLAVVIAVEALEKVVVPGPSTWLQFILNPEAAAPVSVTDPLRVTVDGKVVVWFGPPLTVIAPLMGAASTVMVTSELAANGEAAPLKRNM